MVNDVDMGLRKCSTWNGFRHKVFAMRQKDDSNRLEKTEVSLNIRQQDSSGSEMMNRFNTGLRQVLKTSKAELNRLLAEEKASKAGRTKSGSKHSTDVAHSPRT